MKPKWTLWCQAIPSGKSTSRPAWKFHQFHDGKGWKGGVSFHPDVLHGWRVSSLGANLLIFLGLHSHCFRLVLAHMYLNTYIVFMYIYIPHICCFSPRIGAQGPFEKSSTPSLSNGWKFQPPVCSVISGILFTIDKNYVFSFGICHSPWGHGAISGQKNICFLVKSQFFPGEVPMFQIRSPENAGAPLAVTRVGLGGEEPRLDPVDSEISQFVPAIYGKPTKNHGKSWDFIMISWSFIVIQWDL